MRGRLTGLWSNSDFVKLWIGQTVSDFGNGITGIALPLTAVLVLSATPAQMGILNALEGVAVLLVGLLAGVWVDRLPRRPILIVTDLGRAAILISVPLAALFGVLQIEQLYIVVALTGVLTVFFKVADQSFLPSLVQQEELVEGNSKLGASESIAEIGGPAVAGPLVQLVSAPIAIFFDALSFLFSAFCVGLIRKSDLPPTTPRQRQRLWRDIIEGLRVVLDNPLLRALAGGSGTFNFFGNFIGTLYGLYIIRELGAAPIFVGLLVAAGGIGALVGAFIAERVVQRFGLGVTIGGALLISGVTGFLIPLARGSVIQAVSFLFVSQLVGDVAIAIYLITEVSLRQAIIPSSMLGRANASMQFLTQGLGPIGALIAGVLGGFIGLRLTLLIGVLGIVLASFWLLFSPIRKVKSLENAGLLQDQEYQRGS